MLILVRVYEVVLITFILLVCCSYLVSTVSCVLLCVIVFSYFRGRVGLVSVSLPCRPADVNVLSVYDLSIDDVTHRQLLSTDQV